MKHPALIDIKTQRTPDGIPYELILFNKMHKGLEMNSHERKDIDRLVEFYFSQITFFKNTKPSDLNFDDINLLEKHFRSVFSVSFLMLDELRSNTFYRAVLNKSILKQNSRLELTKHLINPTDEIIQRIGEYGRANTPEKSVLYLSVDEASTMTEIEYEVGDLITVTEWRQEKNFKVLPIALDPKYIHQEEYINKTKKAYEVAETKMHPLLFRLMKEVHSFMGFEFSKDNVDSHFDYLYSASFSYNVFKNAIQSTDSAPSAILYPSVGSDYRNFNVVFEPKLIGDKLRLMTAKEIRITEPSDFRTNNGIINKHDVTGILKAFNRKEGKLIWKD